MKPFIFLDIETTGMDPRRDKIIEIGCLRWEDGEITDRYESLVNPGVPVPFIITQLTGIWDEDVKNAPTFGEIASAASEFIGDAPVVGHNIAFDTGFLHSHGVATSSAEIDTVALARILLLKESSYALEVLMKHYGLHTRDSHRAMADTETALEFFEFLMERIAEIPTDARTDMDSILTKSEWSGKEVFGLYHRGQPRDKAKSPVKSARIADTAPSAVQIYSGQTHRVAVKWTDAITKDFLAGEKILLQSIAGIPFNKLKKEPLVITFATERERARICFAAEAAGLKVGNIKEPRFYLSPKKLAGELARKTIPAEQTPFLLKMINWNHQTLTGDREEVTLEREEYPLFDLVGDENGEDKFWHKAKIEAENCDVIVMHHHAFARGLAEKLADADKRALIILEASRLEDSITSARGKYVTEYNLRPFFGEKAALLGGMLGIFYERFMERDDRGFQREVKLTPMFRDSVEWRRVINTLNNLPEHPHKAAALAQFEPSDNSLQWVSSYQELVTFHNMPILVGGIFQDRVRPFHKVLLQSPMLGGCNGTFDLIRNLLELDSSWKTAIEGDNTTMFGNLDIRLPGDLPDPFSVKYFKQSAKLFEKIISEHGGKILLVMGSKKTVDEMYAELLYGIVQSKTAGKKKIRLLGVGPSGGLGKSIALFMEDPAHSVLLTTNALLPHLSEIEDQIEVIVLQKIPFDPPGDPLLSTRAAQFDNGFEQYSLPRAVIKFREILAELGRNSPGKVCYLLDGRLQTRDYGRMFI